MLGSLSGDTGDAQLRRERADSNRRVSRVDRLTDAAQKKPGEKVL
jgi:hypothetical protein